MKRREIKRGVQPRVALWKGLRMARFFINTGDGFEFASTEDEARKVAAEAIEFWRRAAVTDGEWTDEVASVFWGEIRERAKEIVLEAGEDQDQSDYQLQAAK